MVLTVVQLVLPAIVIVTTLFGVMARGNPQPGGVALFLRVGLVAAGIAGVCWYLVRHTGLLPEPPAFVVNGYTGLFVAGGLCLVMAGFGIGLKRRP